MKYRRYKQEEKIEETIRVLREPFKHPFEPEDSWVWDMRRGKNNNKEKTMVEE